MNFTTVQQDPYNFPAAGRFGDSAQLYYPGIDGYYWTSTPYYTDYAYHLYFDGSYFYPGIYYNGGRYARYYGYPVRCVANS